MSEWMSTWSTPWLGLLFLASTEHSKYGCLRNHLTSSQRLYLIGIWAMASEQRVGRPLRLHAFPAVSFPDPPLPGAPCLPRCWNFRRLLVLSFWMSTAFRECSAGKHPEKENLTCLRRVGRNAVSWRTAEVGERGAPDEDRPCHCLKHVSWTHPWQSFCFFAWFF